MKERDFSLYDIQQKIRIEGGVLWQAQTRADNNQMWQLDTKNKTLSVFLHPTDQLTDVKDGLFELVRQHNTWLHIYFAIQKRIPSVLILVPVSLTIGLIAFGSVMGDSAVAIAFTEGGEDTIFGVSRLHLFFIMAGIAVILLYSFPAFFSGEQEGFIQYINERFSRRGVIRHRFKKAVDFLKQQGYIERVVIWNPHFGEEKADWVSKSLIPAMVDSSVEVVLQIKIDERSAAQNYIAKLTKRAPDDIHWQERYSDHEATQPIPYDYLENWEKRLLAIYTFASTANLPDKWRQLKEGLRNAVSLPLVELIVDRFGERLFSETDLKKVISLDTFASRCVNDFGILEPCFRYGRHTINVWEISDTIVQMELAGAQEEMRFIYSFLEMNIATLSKDLKDPVAVLLINSLFSKASIYTDNRLDAIRYFVQVMRDLEQYKLFKVYWESVVAHPTENRGIENEGDIYRIVGVDWLMDIAMLFEKSALYDKAIHALDFLERVYPYRGKVGKARVAERQGDYEGSVKAMLLIYQDHQDQRITLDKPAIIDLYLNIAWAVVSGRIDKYQSIGRDLLAQAQVLVYADFDKIRSSEQITRLYNITANYEEWAGHPQASLDNYNKALQIPGAEQAGLSNLLVNNGIALRQVGRLHEAARFGESGVEIKTAIGDADQLPIALHNLAQTYILLAYAMPAEARAPYFQKAQRHAQTGLDIQSQTGSVKKRGQLLAERFVATFELAQYNGSPLQEARQYLVQTTDWLAEELKAGRANTYDCRVVVNELLGIVPFFKDRPKTLQEVIRWTM